MQGLEADASPRARNVQAPSLPLATWLASPNPSVPAHRSPAPSGLSHRVRTPVHPHTAPFVFERIRSTSLRSVLSASLPSICALDGPRLSHPRPSAPSYAANRFLQKEGIKEPLSSSSISQINALPHHSSEIKQRFEKIKGKIESKISASRSPHGTQIHTVAFLKCPTPDSFLRI